MTTNKRPDRITYTPCPTCEDIGGPDCPVCEGAMGQYTCSEHGPVEPVGEDQFIGFAGGRCYVTILSCGCQDVDESADLAAAR